jgi:hypothetical protein
VQCRRRFAEEIVHALVETFRQRRLHIRLVVIVVLIEMLLLIGLRIVYAQKGCVDLLGSVVATFGYMVIQPEQPAALHAGKLD